MSYREDWERLQREVSPLVLAQHPQVVADILQLVAAEEYIEEGITEAEAWANA
jgi:hypothetical protein